MNVNTTLETMRTLTGLQRCGVHTATFLLAMPDAPRKSWAAIPWVFMDGFALVGERDGETRFRGVEIAGTPHSPRLNSHHTHRSSTE
jgi:hypothetical protein